jgi:hypothetical protein
MTQGMPVARSLVFILETGGIVVDWGDGRVQDPLTGAFIPCQESDFDRAVTDGDLNSLRNNGRLEGYDAATVFLRPLPEPPRKTPE